MAIERTFRLPAATALVAALTLSTTGPTLAADGTAATAAPVGNDELLKEMRAMEKRIRYLEKRLQEKDAASAAPTAAPASSAAPAAAPRPPAVAAAAVPASPPPTPAPAPAAIAQVAPAAEPPPANKDIFGLAPSPIAGLKLGMYGELKFGAQQNPAANGQWQNGFDTARIVLLPTYQFTDNIIFNSEIEFEHAGSGFDNDDKLHGTAEIEQAYVDFRVSPYFNIRSPGIDLIAFGYINQHHEPTLFYSVNRPELDNGLNNGLIPTTWASPAAGFYGKIVDNLTYQYQLSSSLEDFGDAFGARTAGNTAPAGPYAPGIDGINGLDFATPPRGSFAQLNNSIAHDLQLAYTPPFIPGLAGSTSLYYSPNIEPRGAHADNGRPLGASSLLMVGSEFRYRVPKTGFEFRGEFADMLFGNPRNLRANNDSDPTNNVGRSMWGISGEAAYHLPLGRALGGNWEAVPFYRYTYMDRQTGGFAGSDANAPTGAGQEQFHTVGLALFPTPELVLKLNYQRVLDNEAGGAKSDSVLGAVGWFF
ncbi:MAG TPA: hypothetical protein VET85_00770 [Stellaceae bacterium]|nr:hypothetical protein [Stellaceae bacterium]